MTEYDTKGSHFRKLLHCKEFRIDTKLDKLFKELEMEYEFLERIMNLYDKTDKLIDEIHEDVAQINRKHKKENIKKIKTIIDKQQYIICYFANKKRENCKRMGKLMNIEEGMKAEEE